MKLLLDTHVLPWAARQPDQLSSAALALLADPNNDLMFSPASIGEIAIKRGLARDDFRIDPSVLRRSLLDNV